MKFAMKSIMQSGGFNMKFAVKSIMKTAVKSVLKYPVKSINDIHSDICNKYGVKSVMKLMKSYKILLLLVKSCWIS